MKKYFFTDGKNKFGPLSEEDLKEQNLSRDTLVWFYGLENWTVLSEVEELKIISNSIPPKLKSFEEIETSGVSEKTGKAIPTKEKKTNKGKRKQNILRGIIITSFLLIFVVIAVLVKSNRKEAELYQEIRATAYEADVDFEFYLDKFYRDAEFFGIFPKKPKTTIIKFAKLDQIDNATHIHAISFGINDDDRIEIYINPSTWEKFNKPMRYFLMYHELAHDVLNVDDLMEIQINEGKLMFPAIASYESKTMDDFIESSHELFQEVSAKQNH